MQYRLSGPHPSKTEVIEVLDFLLQHAGQTETTLSDPRLKGGFVRTHKGMEGAHKRITNLTKEFGALEKRTGRLEGFEERIVPRIAEDHDSIVQLGLQLARLSSLVESGVQLNLAASIVGFTDEDIRRILALQDEVQLTSSTLVTAMISRLDVLGREVDLLVDAVAETRGMTNRHEQVLCGPEGLQGRVRNLEHSHGDLHRAIEEMDDERETDGGPHPIVIFLAVAAGIVAGFVWNNIDFTDTIKAQGIKDIPLTYRFAESGWAALLAGIAAFAIVFGVGSMFTGRRRTRRRETRREEDVAQVNDQPTQPQPPATDAPTEVLPATAPNGTPAHAAANTGSSSAGG